MKKPGIFVIGIGILILVLPNMLFAQRGMMWRGCGGWGAGSQYNGMYDPKTVETISGEVAALDTIIPMKSMSYGLHMVVKTEKEEISVHLGPGWFLENQDVGIQAGDKVKVEGSRITFDGKPTIIAAQVKKGDKLLKLRDETGLPVWSGWKSARPGMMWRGSGGWGPGNRYHGMYDPQKVATIAGEVTALDLFTPMMGMSYGWHIMVKTNDGEISVHLGPEWFLKNQDFKIELGDKVEVKGSKINFHGKPAIIAVEIKKGDELLKLRDETGFPVWSGLRR